MMKITKDANLSQEDIIQLYSSERSDSVIHEGNSNADSEFALRVGIFQYTVRRDTGIMLMERMTACGCRARITDYQQSKIRD